MNHIYAARQVPGNVPQTTPLQPVPVDTAPNISRNIEDKPASSAANSPAANPDAVLENLNAAEVSTGGAPESSPSGLEEAAGKPVVIIVLLLVVLAAIGALIWLRKRNAQARKS